MFCWKCNFTIDKKISFHSVCEKCDNDLHVCKMCKFFLEGKPNNCLVPNTEPIYDREKNNLCEDFIPNKLKIAQNSSIKNNPQKKEPFNSLFKDSSS